MGFVLWFIFWIVQIDDQSVEANHWSLTKMCKEKLFLDMTIVVHTFRYFFTRNQVIALDHRIYQLVC